ncbi:hypothetical protein MTO96_042330, partial [Rhipicephalus appendiculatus]
MASGEEMMSASPGPQSQGGPPPQQGGPHPSDGHMQQGYPSDNIHMLQRAINNMESEKGMAPDDPRYPQMLGMGGGRGGKPPGGAAGGSGGSSGVPSPIMGPPPVPPQGAAPMGGPPPHEGPPPPHHGYGPPPPQGPPTATAHGARSRATRLRHGTPTDWCLRRWWWPLPATAVPSSTTGSRSSCQHSPPLISQDHIRTIRQLHQNLPTRHHR